MKLFSLILTLGSFALPAHATQPTCEDYNTLWACTLTADITQQCTNSAYKTAVYVDGFTKAQALSRLFENWVNFPKCQNAILGTSPAPVNCHIVQ